MNREEEKKRLLENPDELMMKKPFFRGVVRSSVKDFDIKTNINNMLKANPSDVKVEVISQEKFMMELDPMSHDVLYDENIPSITAKLENGGWAELKFKRVAMPFQRLIKNKQVLHLTGNPLQHTLLCQDPDEKMTKNFMTFKQYWKLRNQEGMKHKIVDVQLSFGDAGLLYYYDYKGRVKSRILSYKDGYVLCPHNDDNGDRILESVIYTKDGVKYIDSYDDTYMYRWTNDTNQDESLWKMQDPVAHGFDEIPLITKRGDVAWNSVQSLIDVYEVIYNVFNAIQKRYGWGVLYVKGNFSEKGRKLAGNIMLVDNTYDGKGDAKFLTPPTPTNTIETLNLIEESIQKGSCTTFILPKDIRLSGDISGIAISLTQSLDLENALQACIEWKNVADKMTRLFKFGLANELVKSGENPNAVTEFAEMLIDSEFRVWKPQNEYEYNQMIQMMTTSGVLSYETGTELCTLSKPDEKARIASEREETALQEEEEAKKNATQKNICFTANNE